jgi:excisionase family DNA binding protein
MKDSPSETTESNSIKLIKVKEASNMLGISLSFTYKLVETGMLKYVRIGTAIRIRLQDLVDFIESNLIQSGI